MYGAIIVLVVREYLQLLAEGGLKEELTAKADTCYIRFIKNKSVEWFARKIGTCGDYFVDHKQAIVRKQGVHKKIASYINDEYIRSAILTWLQSQKPTQNNWPQQKTVLTKRPPYQ